MSYTRTHRSDLGQTTPAAEAHCPPGYNIVSSPPDSAGNVHPYCERGRTAFLYDTIGIATQIPSAYADMIIHPTAKWMPARITSIATGALGIAGLVSWIRRGRSASTSVKVATPLLLVTSLAAAGLRNGLTSL